MHLQSRREPATGAPQPARDDDAAPLPSGRSWWLTTAPAIGHATSSRTSPGTQRCRHAISSRAAGDCPGRAMPACGTRWATSSLSPTTIASSTRNGWQRIDAEFRADARSRSWAARVELTDPGDQPRLGARPSRTRPGDVAQGDRRLDDRLQHVLPPAPPRRRRRFRRPARGRRQVPSAEDWDFVYRLHKAGAKIVFSPDVLVFHDHGRRSQAEVESLRYGYAIGRWAFYFKHAASFDVEALRVATHDFRASSKISCAPAVVCERWCRSPWA